LHPSAYFWVIVYHGIKTGTDITSPWVKAMYISTGYNSRFSLFYCVCKTFYPPQKKTKTGQKPAVKKYASSAKIKS